MWFTFVNFFDTPTLPVSTRVKRKEVWELNCEMLINCQNENPNIFIFTLIIMSRFNFPELFFLARCMCLLEEPVQIGKPNLTTGSLDDGVIA